MLTLKDQPAVNTRGTLRIVLGDQLSRSLTALDGLRVSIDGGTTWTAHTSASTGATPLGSKPFDVAVLGAIEGGHAAILVGTETGLVRVLVNVSTGAHVSTSVPLPGRRIVDVDAVSGESVHRVLAVAQHSTLGVRRGVWRSENAGVTFTRIEVGAPGADVALGAIYCADTDARGLFVWTAAGLFVEPSRQSAFTRIALPIELPTSGAIESFMSCTDGELYLGATGGAGRLQ